MSTNVTEYRHNYPTEAEAKAFRTGVLCVNDIDVDASEVVQEGNEYVVYVTLSESDND